MEPPRDYTAGSLHCVRCWQQVQGPSVGEGELEETMKEGGGEGAMEGTREGGRREGGRVLLEMLERPPSNNKSEAM
jgi:hypothetical protein